MTQQEIDKIILAVREELRVNGILQAKGKLFRAIFGKDFLDNFLNELSPREREILIIRFGLKDGIPHSLEETGKEFGVTRERIRHIEAGILDKFRLKFRR